MNDLKILKHKLPKLRQVQFRKSVEINIFCREKSRFLRHFLKYELRTKL